MRQLNFDNTRVASLKARVTKNLFELNQASLNSWEKISNINNKLNTTTVNKA